jgi:hypothetical protein
LYQSAEDFFALDGNAVMRLSPSAAAATCEQATHHGLLVLRIEGGVWVSPNFRARGDCIWDGVDPPVSEQEAAANNSAAALFIREQAAAHSAFILTASPLAGRTAPS